jgi:hypothetical protein
MKRGRIRRGRGKGKGKRGKRWGREVWFAVKNNEDSMWKLLSKHDPSMKRGGKKGNGFPRPVWGIEDKAIGGGRRERDWRGLQDHYFTFRMFFTIVEYFENCENCENFVKIGKKRESCVYSLKPMRQLYLFLPSLFPPFSLLYSPIPLFLYSSIPLFLYSSIPLFLYSSIPLFLYSSIPLFLYSSIPPFLHSSIPPFLHSSIPPFLHSSIPPFLHSSIPPFLHASIPPFLYSSIPLFLHSSIPPFLYSLPPFPLRSS